MKSGKAALVLVALAAQWALAGGPPSFASMHAGRIDPTGSSPGPDADGARNRSQRLELKSEGGQVVALRVEITR